MAEVKSNLRYEERANWGCKRRIRLERVELLQGLAKVSELYTAGPWMPTKKLEIGGIQAETLAAA